jgi:hypothetical protein
MTSRQPLAHSVDATQADGNGRRRFLRGVGVGIAIPVLESLLPRATLKAVEAGANSGSIPVRTAFVYVPNGAQQEAWFPSGEGREFVFNRTMQPLEEHRQQIQIIAGLDQQHAEAGPDGAGDHARANATFLTGMRARKTAGSNIRVGQSIDQLISESIGQQTRFPSLELTCDAVRKAGRCDSGYSCAYQYNISWRTPFMPMTPEPSPRKVFERLFGSDDDIDDQTRGLRQQERSSVLDFVLDDARSLRRELGEKDRHKLDQYLTGVRELERRIERIEQFPDLPRPDLVVPEGIPDDYPTHMDLMYDLLAISFQTDATRVATLLLAHDGSNRTFPEVGVSEGHHYLTHHQEEEAVCEKVAKIDLFYMRHFARFLDRLRSQKDVDGTSLLDNSMIVYGSGIADANRHTHDNLPVILAGGGGGSLQPGHYRRATGVPMTNLYLSLLDRLGINDVAQFGDSTGRFGDV